MSTGWLVSRRKSRRHTHRMDSGNEVMAGGMAVLLALAVVVGGATAYALAVR